MPKMPRFVRSTFVIIALSIFALAGTVFTVAGVNAAGGPTAAFESVRAFLGISNREIVQPSPEPTPEMNAPLAAKFWNTNGSPATWTTANWGSSAAGPFATGWTAGDDANFTTTSLITYVTNTAVGNINVTNNSTVTMTSAGTFSTGALVRTLDVGAGSILDFAGQSISTTAGTGFVKSGGGIYFTSNGNAYPGGFTLNGGTVIIGGVNALGNAGPLVINGGTLAANATRNITARYSSVSVGGDFTLGAVTTGVPTANGSSTANITFADSFGLGAATRTITIGSNAIYTLSGAITGAAGTGLSVSNASGATGSLVLSGPNTFPGPFTLNSGSVTLSNTNTYAGKTTVSGGTLNLIGGASIANSAAIELAGGSSFDVQSLTTALTLSSGQALRATGTTSTGTIFMSSTKGLTTAADSPLQFTAFNGSTPPLTVSNTGGTLALQSGNPVTVTVANGGTPLAANSYKLIAKINSATGVTGTPTSLTVNGDGVCRRMH
ncbi:MAG: hypothetical protein QM785_19550 [Pyrinomonadaceae bacterium]